MNYPYYGNPYMPPMPDNLGQLRQQQMMPQQMPQMQNPIPQSGVQWVSGEQEARSWMVAPNAAVALWDSTAPTVYLKQADASGKPTLKVYDLVERLANAPEAKKDPGAEYVTRAELDKLAAIVAEMKAKKKRKVEEEEDDESSVLSGVGREREPAGEFWTAGAEVPAVQNELSGRPESRSREDAAERRANAGAAEPGTGDGAAVSKPFVINIVATI